MKQIFKIVLCTALFLNVTVWASPHANAAIPDNASVTALAGPQLYVEFLGRTDAAMSWDQLSGTGPYHVSVYDLTDGIRITAFTTVALKAFVKDLPIGHVFHFSVSRGVTTLTVDARA